MEKTDFTIALSAQDIELKRLLSEFLLGDDQWWLMFKCSFCRMNMKKMQEAFGNIRIAQIEHLCTTRYELVLSCEESWFNSGVGIKGTGDLRYIQVARTQHVLSGTTYSVLHNYSCPVRNRLCQRPMINSVSPAILVWWTTMSIAREIRNSRMRNRTYDGVRSRKTKVGRKPLRFPPTRFWNSKVLLVLHQ